MALVERDRMVSDLADHFTVGWSVFISGYKTMAKLSDHNSHEITNANKS